MTSGTFRPVLLRAPVTAGLAAIVAVAAASVLGFALPAAATPTDDTTDTTTTSPGAAPFDQRLTGSDEPNDSDTTVEADPDDEPGTTLPDDPDVNDQTDDDTDTDIEADDDTEPVPQTRPNIAPQVRTSEIETGSIALAVLVLTAIGVVSWILIRRPRRLHLPGPVRSGTPDPHRAPLPPTAATTAAPADTIPADTMVAGGRAAGTSTVDTATLDLLIEMGEALIDAGDAVSHVESSLRSLGSVYGIDGLGVLVLPTALVVSVPGVGDVKTEVSTAGRRALRLDQIDDVIHLVNAAEHGQVSAEQGRAELTRIRASDPPFGPSLVLAGYVLLTIGIALLLRAGWREVILAAALGLVVGHFRRTTEHVGASYQPFWPLIAATAVSTVVFTTARFVDDLIVFPALAAPLITFLPGALLTTGMLELATGQIVAGAARLASGTIQLLLLALGIVAGAQLVGVPGGDLRGSGGGIAASLLPWIGIVAFGIGVVWFKGARRSTLPWILISMFAAYAGQVIGGLFFGASLSAFFGATAMTLVALLAARQHSGPTPLVTFLPGFWILVPGALGLEGVTRIIGANAVAAGTGAVTTTVISMVGISLGILLGLALVASDPDRPWADTYHTAEDLHPTS